MESYQTSHDAYRALHEGAVTGAVALRGQVALSGKDRASFLQGLLTNDIPALTPGSGCYAAWLTAQGRMLTDLYVFESGDMMLLDLPVEQVQPTLQRLDQFLFGEDVQSADLSANLRSVWVHGPRAAGLLEQLLEGQANLDAWQQQRNGRATYDGEAVVVVRVDQLGVPGYCLYAAPPRAEALLAALHDAGAAAADEATLTAARIEAGYPVFGVDMTDDTIPLEAGIEARAISFTKGCYIGQEVIIRVLHRGQGRVARKLVALRVHADPPPSGARVFAGDRQVGQITSSARSPRLGAIALAYVHRDFVAAGTPVQVDGGATRSNAVVTERPMPSAV